MAARWLAFVIWAAVAASAVAWALRLGVPSRGAPAYTVPVDTAVSGRADLTRLFGVPTAAPAQQAEALPPADTRFKLVGVVAPRSSFFPGQGLALIAVDGKPARAYRVGAVVDGETVLQEVRPRGASLGPRGAAATVALEIPPLAPPATGTLPAPGAAGAPADAGAPPAQPPMQVPPPPPAPPSEGPATPQV
jgi:general secretion pathway protein C